MKKALGMLLMLAMIALPALAGEGHDHGTVKAASDDVHMGTLHALNNVYMVKDGQKTALCGCGKEFAVSDEKLKIDASGMTMFCCTQECHEHAMAASAEEMEKGMAEWQKMFSGKEMMSNAMMKDGHTMATCACGQTFEVTASTPCLVEDGMKLNACCAGCAEHVMAASAEERHGMMLKAMHTSK